MNAPLTRHNGGMNNHYDIPDECYCYPNYEGECARCLRNAELEGGQ